MLHGCDVARLTTDLTLSNAVANAKAQHCLPDFTRCAYGPLFLSFRLKYVNKKRNVSVQNVTLGICLSFKKT
jgi:hypothetical protein